MARNRTPSTIRPQRQERESGNTGTLRLPGGEPLRIAGLERGDVADNPQDYVGEVFKGAHFRELNVPSNALRGDTLTITGVIHLDNVGVQIGKRALRVKVNGPSLNEPRIVETDSLSHCQTRPFSVDIPTPTDAGEKMALTVKAQSKVGTWNTTETEGPFRVNINTREQQRRANAKEYAPYVLGGAGVGGALASLTGQNAGRLALAGGAVGAGSKVVLGQTTGISFPSFPTQEVAVAGGAALSIVLLLNQTGVADVLAPAGEAAGSAIDTARQAVESGSGGSGSSLPRLPSG